jgi:uncharacterized cupredoxin-like copper-binding protein
MTRRLLMAVVTTTALALLAACGGGSGSGSGSSASTPAATAKTLTFTETEFKIDPASSTVKAGDYTFMVENKGSFPHDFHIKTPDGSEVAKTEVLQANASGTIQVSLKAGTYTFWCAVDGHEQRGMKGTLTVE